MGFFEEVSQVCNDLVNIDSPSGYTYDVLEYIKNYVEDLGLEFSTNKKGLGYCYQKDDSKNLPFGIAGHVDTLGFMVRSITGQGGLKVALIGGVSLPSVDGEYCKIYTKDNKVYTGTILLDNPSAHVNREANSTERSDRNVYIRLDEEVHSKEDVLKLGIENGDFVCIDPKFNVVNDFIKSRFLDDKACVAQMLVLLKNRVKENKKTPIMYFSVHEEVGHGFSNVPLVNKLDEIIAFDMGCVGDDLEGSEYKVSICAMDASGPYDVNMTRKLATLAKNNNIDYALDYYKFYASDGTTSLRAGNDIRVALVGPGIHASHGMERTHKKGVENSYNLLDKYCDS